MGQAVYVHSLNRWRHLTGPVCSGRTKGCASCITDSDFCYPDFWSCLWLRCTWMDEFRYVHILPSSIVSHPSSSLILVLSNSDMSLNSRSVFNSFLSSSSVQLPAC